MSSLDEYEFEEPKVPGLRYQNIAFAQAEVAELACRAWCQAYYKSAMLAMHMYRIPLDEIRFMLRRQYRRAWNRSKMEAVTMAGNSDFLRVYYDKHIERDLRYPHRSRSISSHTRAKWYAGTVKRRGR